MILPPPRRLRESVRVVQRAPFSHCVLGRTPAAGRRNPRWGSVIKRFLGVCGSRSWRGSSWAAKSEPRRGLGQHNSHPLGGATLVAGVRPTEGRRGDVAKHKTPPTSNHTRDKATPCNIAFAASSCAESYQASCMYGAHRRCVGAKYQDNRNNRDHRNENVWAAASRFI